MPTRRLDDRIRELCERVLAASDDELEPAISELRTAFQEHISRLRQMVAENLACTRPTPVFPSNAVLSAVLNTLPELDSGFFSRVFAVFIGAEAYDTLMIPDFRVRLGMIMG